MKQCAHSSRAFTLIEVLVATTILVILVLIMSTIFHQSSVARDAGERKAQGNLTGRALLGFMASELGGAIVDSKTFGEIAIADNGDTIRFHTLKSVTGTTYRAVHQIEYRLEQGRIARGDQRMQADDDYGSRWSACQPVRLGAGISDLRFFTTDGANYTTSMPVWVRIEMGIERSSDVSGVGAWSYGPDKKSSAPAEKTDDISTK